MLVLYDYLTNRFPNKYAYFLSTNYKVLEGLENLPIDKLKKADLFIFQPIHGHGTFDTDFIIDNVLKKNCACISFSYMYFLGYFPDFTNNSNNIKTSSTQFPYGLFPYGHRQIDELIEAGCTPDEIIAISTKEDFLPSDFIWEKFRNSLDILKTREQTTDVRLADFITAHFRTHKLFHSVNHPSNILLKELVKQVLKAMHLPSHAIDSDSYFDNELLEFAGNQMIYPCVAKVLQLDFDTSSAFYALHWMSYADYIHEYIKWLYPQ